MTVSENTVLDDAEIVKVCDPCLVKYPSEFQYCPFCRGELDVCIGLTQSTRAGDEE